MRYFRDEYDRTRSSIRNVRQAVCKKLHSNQDQSPAYLQELWHLRESYVLTTRDQRRKEEFRYEIDQSLSA